MNKSGFQPIGIQPIPIVKGSTKPIHVAEQGFKQHFQTAIEATNHKLAISKHAQLRMNQRHIVIDAPTWTKIETKVQEAKKLGITEALVVTDNAALVISAKNNTVITVMDREEAGAQIFTNINGTILLE